MPVGRLRRLFSCALSGATLAARGWRWWALTNCLTAAFSRSRPRDSQSRRTSSRFCCKAWLAASGCHTGRPSRIWRCRASSEIRRISPSNRFAISRRASWISSIIGSDRWIIVYRLGTDTRKLRRPSIGSQSNRRTSKVTGRRRAILHFDFVRFRRSGAPCCSSCFEDSTT